MPIAVCAEILAQAEEADEEVIVTVNGVPRASLEPIPESGPGPRILGLHPGAMTVRDDFDAPLTKKEWGGEM